MTKEQINQKALKIYPAKMAFILGCVKDMNRDKREGYIKALQEIEQLPKIKGWVARDKSGELIFWENKPERVSYPDIIELPKTMWFACDSQCLTIDEELFPELTFEDEPIEVELIIRRL